VAEAIKVDASAKFGDIVHMTRLALQAIAWFLEKPVHPEYQGV